MSKENFNTNVCFAADPLAMVGMIEPKIVLESKKIVAVELTGRYMRGMTVVDWFGLSQQQPNVEIIQKVNWERFIELMKSIIA
jgi:inosine-uridine nucleoside N-ribohydrolase